MKGKNMTKLVVVPFADDYTQRLNQLLKEETQKNASFVNAGLTAGGIAAIAAGAVGADKLITKVKTAAGNPESKISKFIAEDKVKKAIKLISKNTKSVRGLPVIKKSIKLLEKGKTQVTPVIENISKSVKGLNPKVKIAAAIGTGLLVASSLYKAGQIKGQTQGINQFKEASDAIVQNIKETFQGVQQMLNIDK